MLANDWKDDLNMLRKLCDWYEPMTGRKIPDLENMIFED